MIVPGLDGRLYWRNPNYGMEDGSAAPMLQELPLTVAGLLENPVRSCNPHTNDQEDQNDCGILTAQAETSLLAISGSGELLWKSRNSDDATATTSSLPSLLLQRKDYWIQHIHAATGKQSWNVSLGTYQALDFSTPDEQEQRERHSNHPKNDEYNHNNNNKLLSDQDDNDDAVEEEDADFNVDDAVSPPVLPAIFFSNHGRRLSAVDPRTREILWRQDVPSTFSAVFGISNGQWKTLEIVDDSELMKIMMITHHHQLQEQEREDDATNPPQFMPGQDFRNRVPVVTNPWIQELEEFLWQQQQQQYRAHAQHIPIHKALPGGSVSDSDREQQIQQQGNPHAEIYTRCVLLGGDSCPNLKQLPLRLPGPTTNNNIHAKGVFLLEEGLLLSWKLVSIIMIILVLAGVGIRIWYLRKKAKWMDPSHALPKPNTADTILMNHSSSGDISGTQSPLLLVRKRSNSLPGKLGEEVFGRDPVPPSWKNANASRSSDDAIQSMTTPSIPKRLPLPSPQPLVPSRPVHDMIIPRTITNITSNSAIPLVRYSRYASEFQELRALGKGGFGSVFQCKNSLDGRDYAIKKVCIRGASSDDAKFQIQLDRVLREVKNLAVLNHPCIVRYYTAWLELEERKNADENSTTRQLGDETGSAMTSAFCEKPSGIIRRQYSSSNLLASDKYDSGWGDHTMSSRKFDGDDDDSSASDWDVPGRKNGWDRTIQQRRDCVQTDAPQSREELEALSFMPRRRSLRNRSSLDDLVLFEDSHEEKGQSQRNSQDDKSIETSPTRRRRSFSMGDNAATFADKSIWSNSLKSQIVTNDRARTSMKHTLYIQMELCSQNTVAEFLADAESRRGPASTTESSGVDVPKALGLFLQIAEAVKHVHEQGLIHRDLKPSNCFMNESGTVKVGDFGLSRESSNDEENNGNKNDGEQPQFPLRTVSNEDHTAGVGTRSYASPEQMKGSDYDSSTDVYSLGIILFELLYPMYTGMERGICLSQLRDHKFPLDWEQVVGDNFPTMKELIIRMLSWRPSERPTADSVVRQIQAVLGEYRVSSLDKQHFEGKPDMIILRVEAIHRDDALSTTMKLIREESCLIDTPVEIVHYGLRSGSTGNQQPSAIMEFALKFHNSHHDDDTSDQTSARNDQSAASSLVQQLCKHPDILKARQISSGVLSSSSGMSLK
jgi:serine/threonine protein kinase